MFTTFFSFEVRYWMRRLMVYVFLAVVTFLVYLATSSDNIQIGGGADNTFRNSPFVIQNFYAAMSFVTLLMTTAFVNSAATREFTQDTAGIIFSTPIRKTDYLLGRFLGSVVVAVVPILGVSLGIVLASLIAGVSDPERYTSYNFWAHLNSILIFAVPNTFLIGAIIFAIAIWTRSTIASFVGALALLIGYSLAGELLQDLDNQTLAMMIDPFGINTYNLVTKYWTASDKNNLSVGLTGWMLANRLLWVGIGTIFLAVSVWRFTFTERTKRGKAKDEEVLSQNYARIPSVQLTDTAATNLSRYWSEVKINFRTIVKSTVFVMIALFAIIDVMVTLYHSTGEGYGISSLPVTYRIIHMLVGSSSLFLIAIITFFSGAMIWREREAKFDEVYDALAFPTWVSFCAKFAALMGIVAILLALDVLCGVVFQSLKGFYNFQLGLYARDFFLFQLLFFGFWAILATLSHTLAPNKYVGYFIFVVVFMVNAFTANYFEFESKMLRFAAFSNYTYSDFYGIAPYFSQVLWFGLYWFLFCGLLAAGTAALWQRGRETHYKNRFGQAFRSLRGTIGNVGAAFLFGFLCIGGWVYYNTLVVNKVEARPERHKKAADYERSYKQYENLPQPRIVDVKYNIQLFPERRDLIMRGEEILQNKTDAPVDKVHLNLAVNFETDIELERATLEMDDKRLNYQIYTLSPALQPNETVKLNFTVKYNNRGFENDLSQEQIMPNGTFFNSTIAPQIGYQAGSELQERSDRRRHGLPEKELMPRLERDCTANCMNTYISNNSDWVNVETIISTAADQTAIAPGSLVREWTENGRRYFHYRLDHKALNFYSFLSARYEVAREIVNGVNLEVYYHKGHEWNVPKMMNALRSTYEYATANFGEYKHKQLRIIEFPRVGSFAQAFPGSMPYSESIGFIANLETPDAIDMATYIVAHEIGHQWWAHQVCGANMQGATLLSETLAQYTALMVMEREYGRDMMRKFLQYEADAYLRGRGGELMKEQPLQTVEADQGYIHYNKGSLVMYYLKEMIGEDKVNAALREIIQNHAYKDAPYPTSYVLTDALRGQTPPEFQYLLKDLFEDITLFANRTTEATAKKHDDGRFEVTIKVLTQKLKADEKGLEQEIPIDDFIEIGAFAAPESGKRYGETLHRERVKVNKPENVFTFTVDELPEKAGIDPFALLVDRQPDDNLKSVSEQ
ncbi:MAG TPA: M1 family aminopeptidase [Pyrinomonadaceae bacterium]|jgi:ABC-type transport system involved in multi-copper enzyme maturation permease subunit